MYFIKNLYTAEYRKQCDGYGPAKGPNPGQDICNIMGNNACVHGTCVAIPERESFYCDCDDGYVPSEDRRKCQGSYKRLKYVF